MSNLDVLITRARTSADTAVLADLADLYLSETTTPEDRQTIRSAAADPGIKQAYENLYFDGVGMEQPETFVRRTLAALFMTRGFSSSEVAHQVTEELHTFATHHDVDYAFYYEQVRARSSARPANPRRTRFILGNLALIGTLVLGTVAVQAAASTLRLVLQIALLLGVVGGQMALLYWYFRT